MLGVIYLYLPLFKPIINSFDEVQLIEDKYIYLKMCTKFSIYVNLMVHIVMHYELLTHFF